MVTIKEILIIEGEWECSQQEGGYAYPAIDIGDHDLGKIVDNWLGIKEEGGKSGVNIKITIERI